MATGNGVNQGKTAFLEGFLPDNRDADEGAVNQAWRAEGHDDDISGSLVSKTRSRLKIPKKRVATGGADAGSMAKGKDKSKGAKGKARSREVEAPPQPNLQQDEKGPTKTAFVGELLGRESDANLKQVNEAWASAGHEGTISSSIFFKAKRDQGGTRETSPASSKSEPGPSTSDAKSSPRTQKADQAAGPPEAASSPVQRQTAPSNPTTTTANRADGHGQELHKIEGEIDELMFRLKGLGNFAEVQEALRAARRLLVRSHGH